MAMRRMERGEEERQKSERAALDASFFEPGQRGLSACRLCRGSDYVYRRVNRRPSGSGKHPVSCLAFRDNHSIGSHSKHSFPASKQSDNLVSLLP